jgi:hypothetical protein
MCDKQSLGKSIILYIRMIPNTVLRRPSISLLYANFSRSEVNELLPTDIIEMLKEAGAYYLNARSRKVSYFVRLTLYLNYLKQDRNVV